MGGWYNSDPLLPLALCSDSPVSPESWLLSLMFVVVVTMVKQGYEDYLRSAAVTRELKNCLIFSLC